MPRPLSTTVHDAPSLWSVADLVGVPVHRLVDGLSTISQSR
jgi:hypothetical protein